METSASAVDVSSAALWWPPNWFQDDQPMGGVRARPFSFALTSAIPSASASEKRDRIAQGG